MFRFAKLREEHLSMVLAWRIKERVTKYQKTDIANDLEAQKAWFKGLRDDFWVVHHDDRPIGSLTLSQDGSWGFYIGEDDAVPLGGLVLPYFYNHYFGTGKTYLMADVMAGNDGIMRLHRFHGHMELGVREEKVVKYGKPHDIHVFVLSDFTWTSHARRYRHFVADFER